MTEHSLKKAWHYRIIQVIANRRFDRLTRLDYSGGRAVCQLAILGDGVDGLARGVYTVQVRAVFGSSTLIKDITEIELSIDSEAFMPWSSLWPTADERGLARYVTPDAIQVLAMDKHRIEIPTHAARQVLRDFIEALYVVLLKKKIRYASEPYQASLEQLPLRMPHEIVDTQCEGTSLELALLFCGLCLGYELVPLIVITKEHAFAMVSLEHNRRDALNRRRRPELRAFHSGQLSDSGTLRKLIDNGRYLAVECTGFAHSTTMSTATPEGQGRVNGMLSFRRACAAGYEHLDLAWRPLHYALDCATLHEVHGFTPFEYLFTVEAKDRTNNAFKENTQLNSAGADEAYSGGNQTTISGDVIGPILSGTFHGPVTVSSSTNRPASSQGKAAITSESIRPIGYERRCIDLAVSIDQTLSLIRQYEEQRRLANDPREQQRAERSVADLRIQLETYQQEQRELGCGE